MKTLLEYVELGSYNNLLKEMQELEEAFSDIMANAKSQQAIAQRRAANSNSKVTVFPVEELNHKMGEALKRLEAAYRGLGLTNKLTNPEEKLNNRSRIMSNIHKIRGILKDVEAKLASENQQVIGSPNNNPSNTPDAGNVTEDVVDMANAREKKEGATFKTGLTHDDARKAREAVVKNSTPFTDDDGVRSRVIKAIKKKLSKKVDEAWEGNVELNPKKKGMFKGKTKEDLEKELASLKKSGPHKKGTPEYTKEKELNFAIRAKSNWK